MGERVYLFEESRAASALCTARKKKARDLLISFIHVRLDQLEWSVGEVIGKGRGLAYVARRLEKDLQGKDLLVISQEAQRLCLDRIELPGQPL